MSIKRISELNKKASYERSIGETARAEKLEAEAREIARRGEYMTPANPPSLA